MSIRETSQRSKLERFFTQKIYQPIATIEELREYLQNAVTLEFATIPPYLTAMYSMKDASSSAYQLTQSVALEEMFHVYQAANMLISIGGIPKLTGVDAPVYPTFIPNADESNTPYINPSRATKSVYKNVFMKIEKPAPYSAPAQGENFQTIGQFYKAIYNGFVELGSDIYGNTPGYTQYLNLNIGNGAGRIVNVTNLNSAGCAIEQIMQQGEGAVEPGKTLVAQEPWGLYNGYVDRIDGEYGPVIGLPLERSHYFKFKKIADGESLLPDTHPIISAPSQADFYDQQNPILADLNQIFNIFYTILLHVLENSFKQGQTAQNIYFQAAIPIMHKVLPDLAKAMMQIPLWSDGDSNVGPNGAPTWLYLDNALLKTAMDNNLPCLIEKCQKNVKKAPNASKAALFLKLVETLESVKGAGQQVQALFTKRHITL
ncbi:ferritin-like domain-containing protein [Candidatus Albibeggiatoa sp. nov. BB20]|uniref:ferritin-like domain-containing protein n=1 Tax=Candidatus Albibeggiatoa sp. nov. BB20 TaxID=3162723 RepID=UPI0033659E5F